MDSPKNKLPAFQPISLPKESCNNHLVETLLREEKSIEDAYLIYEKIKHLSFFHNFFSDKIKRLDLSRTLNICQGFKYEKHQKGSAVLKQGDLCNGKFYIILNGEVAVVSNQRVGEFGVGSGASLRIPGNGLPYSSKDTFGQDSDSGETSPRDSECLFFSPRVASNREICDQEQPKSGTINEVAQEESTEQENTAEAEKPKQTRGVAKIRAVCGAMKAMRLMQRCLAGGKKKAFGAGFKALAEADRKERQTLMTDLEDVSEEKEFERLANKYGMIVQVLKSGESFGEKALTRNKPRNATILCKTECEFLTLEKQQFDEVFGQIEREKEEFLTTVLPQLRSFSSANLNFLVCCFRTQKFSKGSYIINEGKNEGRKAKFYVIQAGECILEKKVAREYINPYDKKRKLLCEYENIQIAVAGKGAVFGEEILETGHEYDYSVKVYRIRFFHNLLKAVSEIVVVQAVTRRDFRSRFPYDFSEFLLSTYEAKKQHREVYLENLKKENKIKVTSTKKDNIYSLQNASIADLTTKAAKQCFSRQINRDNILTVEPVSAISMHASPRSPTIPTRDLPLSANKNRTMTREASPDLKTTPSKYSVSRFRVSDNKDRQDKISMKINFLSRVASPIRKTSSQNEIDALENAKFFIQAQSDKDRRTIKIRLAQMNKDSKINQQMKKLPVIESVLAQSPTDALLHKYRSKHEIGSPEKNKTLIHLENRLNSRSGYNSLNSLPSRQMIDNSKPSRKVSIEQEYQSTHLQRVHKEKYIRDVSNSPGSTKPTSLNEAGSLNNIHTNKMKIKRMRKSSSFSVWSANSFANNSGSDYVVDDIKVISNKQMLSTYSGMRPNLLDIEPDKEYLTSLANIDREKTVVDEKYSSINSVENKKATSRVHLVPSVRVSTSGGFYTHLNEVKQRRAKLFRKPGKVDGPNESGDLFGLAPNFV